MDRTLLVRELEQLDRAMPRAFPYADFRKMSKHERLISHFADLGDDNWLTADFNTYYMCILGIASRILHGTEDGTSVTSLQWLALGDFFKIFPKYGFLENEWEPFVEFAQTYVSLKRMQEIELALLLTEDMLLALKEENPTRDWGHFLGRLTVIKINSEEDSDSC